MFRQTFPIAYLSVLAFLTPLTSAQPAQPNAPRPQKQADLITRDYDISDLLKGARPDDQPDPTPKTLAADTTIGSLSPSRSESREGLARLLTENVDPKSWRPAGLGTLAIRGDTYIVTQTESNHRQITRLLQQLRGDASSQLWNEFSRARLPANTRFDRTEFAPAVAAIAKAVNTPIVVDYKSFEKVNVEFDTPVTADVSGLSPDRAVRNLIRAAANLDVPLQFDATPDTIKVSLDRTPDDAKISAAYDVRHLPARVAGLDPTKQYPRQAVLDALVERVKKKFNLKDVRAHSTGLLVINAPHKTQLQLKHFFEQLEDPQAPKP